ncbi:MAG: LacI family DNA-binding transcriptional regulator [Firmicutes bacterium]|nr:LacI family DNA-binding transcriptional regulator [Bacillota bacterium]
MKRIAQSIATIIPMGGNLAEGNNSRRLTIADVAQEAGVSSSTVSRTLSGKVPVNDDTKKRVLAAIKKLGFTPNAMARSLRNKSTQTIGLVLPDLRNPFFSEIAWGVENESLKQGYNVLLCNTANSKQKELSYARVLAEKRMDGVVFAASGDNKEAVQFLTNLQIPMILIDRYIPDMGVDIVMSNNESGCRMAMEYLANLGHREIGMITGNPTLITIRQRSSAYYDFIKENGLPSNDKWIVFGCESFDDGYNAGLRVLSTINRPTAIIAGSDLIAVGVMSAARELQLRVPQDVSIVGYDDVPLSRLSNPPLTTIRQPISDMGKVAVRLLVQKIRGTRKKQTSMVLPVELIVRGSTCPPS